MNKNAYEIRLDVLSYAMGLVQDEFSRKWSVWERKEMEGKTSETAPKFPGTQEILDKADELYKFVENK